MAKDRQKVIQAAEKLAARGRIQAAIDEYRKVLDRHPNDTTTLNRVGDLYVRLNRLPKAIDLFQKTAESFSRQGFFVKAIAIYKKMIRLDPGQIRAYEALADLYHKQGLTGDSLAQYQVVADYYVKHGEVESALNVHHSMVEIEPENPSRRLQLSDILQKQGKLAEAQEQYQAIADLMLEHSRGEDAFKVLVGALEVDASNLDFVRGARESLQAAGFDRLSEDLLNEATRRNPEADALKQEAPVDSAEAVETQEPVVEQAEAEEPPSEATPVEEAASEEVAGPQATDEESTEIDLSELEDLPAAGLEPTIRSSPAEEIAEEVSADDGESSFQLEDTEVEAPVAELEVEAPAAEPDAVPPVVEAEAAPEEDFSFELDIDEVSAQLAEAGGDVAEAAASSPAEEAPPVEPAEVAEVEPAEAAEVAPAEVAQADTAEPESVEPRPVEPVEASRPETAEEVAQARGEWIKLLIEADVLERYGMHDTAAKVVQRVLDQSPEHAGAQAMLAALHLAADRLDEALALADGLASRVERGPEPERWRDLREALEARGYKLQGGRFVGDATATVEAPAATPEPELEAPVADVEAAAEAASEPSEEALELPTDEALAMAVDSVLEEVDVEPAESPAEEVADEVSQEVAEAVADAASDEAGEQAPQEAAPLSLEQIVAESAELSRTKRSKDLADGVLADVIEEIERDESSEPPEAPAAAAPAEIEAESLLAEVELTDAESPAEAPPEAAAPVEETPAEPLADAVEVEEPALSEKAEAETASVEAPDAEDVEWIRELERAEAAAGSTAPLEPGTGEFVDLATEIEAELNDDDGGFEDELLPSMGEQSLEDIVEGFRQGMAETLADEDYDTHYNLGIAYREMGLVDEAIGEFQLAAKDPRYLVECCSHLASCFVDKNFNDLAVQWYARGLESSAIDEDSRCGLLYELGSLLVAIGEPDAARERFLELYGINSNYRDVVAKLEELPS